MQQLENLVFVEFPRFLFGHKMEVFLFQNNPKNLNLSVNTVNKQNLDPRHYFGSKNTILHLDYARLIYSFGRVTPIL